MEIRKNVKLEMEDSGSPNQAKEDYPGPLSPCDSEISVGCENDRDDDPHSPMEMAEYQSDNETHKTNGKRPNVLPIPLPIHQSPRSHHSLSPSSARDDMDSNSCLSEDEYFRPLKRLAMCESSPQSHSVPQDRVSNPANSPMAQLPLASPPFQNPSNNQPNLPSPNKRSDEEEEEEEEEEERESSDEDRPDDEEIERNRAEVEARLNAEQKLSGLRSFSIIDILSYKPSRRKSSIPVKIVRPWDTREESRNSNSNQSEPQLPKDLSIKTNNNNNRISNNKRQNNDRGSALDALFQMTNKTLDDLNKDDKADAVNLFNNRQPSKKKRKSRTAFTNHQIFELEKRFLYQKYLSPADRDELAQNLGLSNAQVITWFQNRRAKLKRDMEELKRDVQQTKSIHSKVLLEASANVVAYLKAKDMPKISLASLRH